MTDYAPQYQTYGSPAAGRDMTAVMGRRTLAWVIDLAIFFGILIAVFSSFAEYVDVPSGVGSDACNILQHQDADAASSCFVVQDRAYIMTSTESGTQTLISLGYLAFFIVLQGLAGGSPGKLLTGLRVVDERGQRAGIGRSLVRTLLWVVDGAPWFLPLVGFIVGLTSTGHRRVGDMAAKTYVVSRKDVGTPVQTSATILPLGQQPWGAPPTSAPTPPPPTANPWSVPTPPTAAGAPEPPGPSEPIEPPVQARGPVRDVSTPLDEVSGPVDEVSGPVDEVSGPVDEASAPRDEVSSPVDQPAPDVEPDPAWWNGPEANPGAATSAGPAPFVAPGAEPPSTTPPSATPPTRSPAPEPERAPLPPPQWDQARNTYIQWEPNQQTWLQWDTAANRWKPIDT